MRNKFTIIFAGLFFLLLGLSFYSGQNLREWDFETFGKLPVVQGGRVKPLDSVARNSLLILSGKQSFVHNGAKVSAIHWLADMVFNPQVADQYPVFEIDHPEVLGLLHIEQGSRRRFSYNEIHQYNSELEMQSIQIGSIKPQDQTAFQRAVVLLVNRVNLYQKLENTVQLVGVIQTADDLKKFQELSVGISTQDLNQPLAFGKTAPLQSEFLSRLAQHFRFVDSFSYFLALPPLSPNKNWQTLGAGLLSPENGVWHQGILAYAQMADFYRAGNKDSFNATVKNYFEWVGTLKIKEFTRTKAEFIFNRVEPFYFCMVFYFLISLLIFINWLTKSELTVNPARILLGLTFSIHSVALLARMIIQGRPPVTNLYSSAIFVGWVAIVLGIFIEKTYKNLFGALVSVVIGFLTLLIAHHLSVQGDTLEMMQAVLDSNFWLATHVVTVTMGYGSTFLAGFIATVYILKKSFSTTFQNDQARSLVKMAYGVICFATLFSFIGTILGGIWADQSWGRFWGWDPKENGALMIVLWNVTILHARWGGYAKDRGVMILAVIGNVVTSLSWFGVNMLGIGLHSYGFMDKAFYWLCGFIVIQAFIVVMGLTLKKE